MKYYFPAITAKILPPIPSWKREQRSANIADEVCDRGQSRRIWNFEEIVRWWFNGKDYGRRGDVIVLSRQNQLLRYIGKSLLVIKEHVQY